MTRALARSALRFPLALSSSPPVDAWCQSLSHAPHTLSLPPAGASLWMTSSENTCTASQPWRRRQALQVRQAACVRSAGRGVHTCALPGSLGPQLTAACTPRPPAPAAGGKGSDGSCLSDSGTPLSSGTPPLTAAGPVPSGAMSGAATAQHPHLLHAQQPHGAAAMAWPMVPGMPMPQLAQVAVMPAPAAQLRAGLMAVPVGKLPVPVSNGKSGCALNGRTSASSQRQATNREAQKRYRWAGRPGGAAGLPGLSAVVKPWPVPAGSRTRRPRPRPRPRTHGPACALQGAAEGAAAGDAGGD